MGASLTSANEKATIETVEDPREREREQKRLQKTNEDSYQVQRFEEDGRIARD